MSMNKISSNTIKLVLNNSNSLIFSRCLATHWNPKYKKLRAQKWVKPHLPEYEKIKQNTARAESSEERRARFIKEGISPPISFEYRPINFSSSGEILDPYIPPEGDGKASLLSKQYFSNALEQGKKLFSKKFKHVREIRRADPSFDSETFAEQAQNIYIEAHKALQNRDSDKLLEYATENAYAKMWVNMRYKTMRWKFIETLEQPVVTHLTTREMLDKKDIFAQVTVRIHSKQTLAVYDRFGRLAFGSDKLEQDVLEYVVFERYLTGQFGSWRMHDKIVPEWAPPKTPILRSFIMPKMFKIDEGAQDRLESKFKKDESHLELEAAK